MGGCLAPRSIAPTIYLSPRKKVGPSGKLSPMMRVMQIDTSNGLSVQHLQEFVKLWEIVSHTHLVDDTPDSILWKLTSNGEYSCSLAYNAHFVGAILSPMDSLVWKNWAPDAP
jgi:hypothetical protein